MISRRKLVGAALPLALLAACGTSASEHLRAAEQAFAGENYAAARVAALASLKKDSASVPALLVLIRSQLRLGDGEGAATTLDRLKRASGPDKPGPDEMARFAAETALLRGHPDEALGHLGVDNSAPAWRIRALVHLARNENEQAMTAFRTGVAAGEDPVLLATYARLLIASGSLDEAGRITARLIAVAPQGFDTQMTLGQLEASRGNQAAALAAYQRATGAHPERYEPLLARAQLVANQGKLAEAAKLLEKAAQIAPDARDVLVSRIQILAARKAWPKIVALMQGIDTSLEAGSAEALAYAEALLNTGRPEQARVLLSRALLMRPGDRHIRRLLGEAQLASGDAEGAYESILPLASGALATLEDVQALRRASDAAGYIETRDIDARLASAQFRSDAALAARVRNALDNGQWARAVAAMERLLAVHPEDSDLLAALAESSLNAGQFAAASAYAERALTLDADNALAASTATEARRKLAAL